MDRKRKQRLRFRYLRLTRRYEERLAQWSCGRQIAEAIDKDLYRWGQEIEEIAEEVRHAIKEEEAVR